MSGHTNSQQGDRRDERSGPARTGTAGPARAPLLALRGGATAPEIAALVAVLAVARQAAMAATASRGWRDAASSAARGPDSLPAWQDRASVLRPPPRPGPGAWRASALPR